LTGDQVASEDIVASEDKGKSQMTRKIKNLGVIGLMSCLIGLAACSSPTPTVAPTLDLNPFRTEVASTVLAQVTQDLALTPSITPLPTSTATSTATSTPVQATSASPSLTTTLSITTITTLVPTIALPDRAQWVSQSIPDDTVFAPGESFTMTWELKNVGASTWTAAYLLRYFSGELFGAPKEIVLGQQVLPGATIAITVKMTAPATAGKYRSDWVLSNETRSNFKDAIFLKITVARPPTPTRAPTATLTPAP
jgi:hypothetical protein